MAANVLADTGFIVALLNGRDTHHDWAVSQAEAFPPPWKTCDAALSEAFFLLGSIGEAALGALLLRRKLLSAFRLNDDVEAVLRLMEKYADTPMSLADACLVRMTEVMRDPLVLTTDADFRVYRRHGRQTVPCSLPV